MCNINIPYFFFTNSSIGAPQGDTLGHIYPFFNNTSGFIFNSFNLCVLILYGLLEIGVAIGTNSREKSIYFNGGNLVVFQTHLHIPVVLENIIFLGLYSFMVPPHELHTTRTLF